MFDTRRFALSLVLLLSTIVIMTLPLAAQVDQVAINGTVTDALGAAVPGAKVELLSLATGLHRVATTDAAGIYHFPALPIGNYKIAISKEGFHLVEIHDLKLAVGQPRTIDVRLEIGAISETVQVATSVETLNRSSAEVGGLGSFTGSSPTPSASFGKITGILNTGATGTGAPRRIEFMLRLEF